MSRMGKKPIKIPEGVEVEVRKEARKGEVVVLAKGPKGRLEQRVARGIGVKVEGGKVWVERLSQTKKAKALHGLTRSLINNQIGGVSKGWNKGLELHGVGYRAELKKGNLILNIGYSHPVKFGPVEGINFEVSQDLINVSGVDKQKVGQVAAEIRAVRKPEPYKGKGIRYVGEVIRRKLGKAAKTAFGGVTEGK